ncbi:hypothetical protein AJ80_01884 [Polytolypa hystricis UAMH7299]|uniref:Uncharacterized protein n=1 Tax=Polytolypa hystricis (strain UAMH7299) TaxID=1447883 RepID=A0A2B7YXK5_POLH7|nr:hypothetical protein AJ80_01884 [Polytolypa hystricis UAMH7299]
MFMFFARFLRSQLFVKLPHPTTKFTGQTIIVTGSNSGLGLEAAQHFVRLGAAKVILAVRTVSKGHAAVESITSTTQCEGGVLEVWHLDLESYTSVQEFAKKAMGLDQLDIVVANAGMYKFEFSMAEKDEKTITVNVINTLLLGLLLLPKLRETSVVLNKKTILTFTGSFTYEMTKFPERKNKKIIEYLAKSEMADMDERYFVSKLIQLLLVRELADEVTKFESSGKAGRVIVSTPNPGAVDTSIMREAGSLFQIYLSIMKVLWFRSAEEGSRTLLHAAQAGEESHGQYLDDCKVGRVSSFVQSEDGARTQKQLWKEFSEKVERIYPGVMENI